MAFFGIEAIVDAIIKARDGDGEPVRALALGYNAAVERRRHEVRVVHGSTVADLRTCGDVIAEADVALGVAYLYVDWILVPASFFEPAIIVLKRIVAALFFQNEDWGATWSHVLRKFERAVANARTRGAGTFVFAAHVGSTTNPVERWRTKLASDSLRERVLKAFQKGMDYKVTFEMVVFGRVADLPIYCGPAFVEACEVALQMMCKLLRGFGEGGSGTFFGSEREKITASNFAFRTDAELAEELDRRVNARLDAVVAALEDPTL